MGFYQKVVAFGSQVVVGDSMNNKIPIQNFYYLCYLIPDVQKVIPYPL